MILVVLIRPCNYFRNWNKLFSRFFQRLYVLTYFLNLIRFILVHNLLADLLVHILAYFVKTLCCGDAALEVRPVMFLWERLDLFSRDFPFHASRQISHDDHYGFWSKILNGILDNTRRFVKLIEAAQIEEVHKHFGSHGELFIVRVPWGKKRTEWNEAAVAPADEGFAHTHVRIEGIYVVRDVCPLEEALRKSFYRRYGAEDNHASTVVRLECGSRKRSNVTGGKKFCPLQ